LNIAAADLLHEQGRMDEAADCLGRALRGDPSRAAELTDRFEQLIAQNEGFDLPSLWRRYAEALRSTGRLDQVARACREAIHRLDPRHAGPFHAMQAEVLIEEGRLSEAIHLVQRNLSDGTVHGSLAADVLRQIVAVNPGHSVALLLLGRAATNAGRFDEAIDAYVRAIEADPALQTPVDAQLEQLALRPGIDAKHLFRLAQHRRAHDDPAGAAQFYRRSLRLDPSVSTRVLGELQPLVSDGDAHLELVLVAASAAGASERVDLACELLLRVNQRDPTRSEIVLAELRRLRDAQPTSYLPAMTMARVLLAQGSQEGAARTIIEAAEHEHYPLEARIELLHEFHRRISGHGVLALSLARLLQRKGAWESALELVEEHRAAGDFDARRAAEITGEIASHPGAPVQAHLVHHDLLIQLGQIDAALHALPEPSNAPVRQLHSISSRFEEQSARVHRDPTLAARCAQCFWMQGRTEEAIETLRAATEGMGLASTHPLWTEFARLLHEAGQIEEGRQILATQTGGDPQRQREAHQLYSQWNEGRTRAEIETLRERLRARPHAVHLALELAEKLAGTEQFEEVIDLLRRPVPEGEWQLRRACLLAQAYSQSGRSDVAEALLMATAEDDQDPGGRWAQERHYRLAECAEQLGRPGEASARYRQLIDTPEFGASAATRARRSYARYLEDVIGDYRAVIEKVSSL
jgi:tetratricopeptide (TPR) repeat protein